MTRVNVINPCKLYDQHLMAEYREIPMVMGSLSRSLQAVDWQPERLSIPPTYRMGSGHVSFFYNKGEWLHTRFMRVYAELLHRGFKLNLADRSIDWQIFHVYGLWENDWRPSKAEKRLNKERIALRVSEKPEWYRRRK